MSDVSTLSVLCVIYKNIDLVQYEIEKNINNGQLLTTNLNLSNPENLHLKFSNQDYKHTVKNTQQLLVKITFTNGGSREAPRNFWMQFLA